jgi:hypothetical protein
VLIKSPIHYWLNGSPTNGIKKAKKKTDKKRNKKKTKKNTKKTQIKKNTDSVCGHKNGHLSSD